MRPILITGAKGQLGLWLQKALRDYDLLLTDALLGPNDFDVAHLNIADEREVTQLVSGAKPGLIINCAAYTAVDKAELPEEAEAVFSANVTGPSLLADAAEELGIPLIHISTDYVFNGGDDRTVPYTERDDPLPLGVYGQSKQAGEREVMQKCQKYYIIRTSGLHSQFGKNFVKTMVAAGKTKPQLSVVCDQHFSPTYAGNLADHGIRSFVDRLATDNPPPYGIYHYADHGVCSWFDLAELVIEKSKGNAKVLPITAAEYAVIFKDIYGMDFASRPDYSALNCSKFDQIFGTIRRPWEFGVTECLDQLNHLEAQSA